MKQPFLSKRSLFGVPNAFLILLAIFFFVPWAMRAARMSLQKTENNVKDWLPADFRETSELAWFGEYFAGERFVLATWPGCTVEDQRLKLFASKLRAETAGVEPQPQPPNWEAAQKIANELRLMLPASEHKNWGDRDEKWLISEDDRWYFLTPDGKLFRWEGEANVLQAAVSGIKRISGGHQVEGTFVAAFGGRPSDGAANPYYNDPVLLTAPLFRTVQTGPEVAAQLAAEGGPLWPVDLTDPELKPLIAHRRAVERLTGTLFAPAVPHDFGWTAEAFLDVISLRSDAPLPEDLPTRIELALEYVIEEDFDGEREQLLTADSDHQARAWYAVFDAIEIPPPPRQTCAIVTLTPLGERNLPHVVGRGVMGGPRGRLLTLAEQSGLEAAPVPSAAPPPFNTVAEIGGSGRPPLRLGGPPVDNVTIDEEGTITLSRLIGYSVLIGFGLSYICFRSMKVTIMVFAVGGLSAMFGMAMVGWSNTAVDAILLSMPSLVYVLGLSSAIHVINYYRDEVETHGLQGAPGRALRHAVIPCTLAAVTTAIGLMSLYTSNITPIRKFGLFSALGVIATIGILFAYLPAALETFVPKLKNRQKTEQGGLLRSAWETVGEWIVQHYRLVATACVLVLLFSIAGLFKIQTTVQLLKMFSSDSRIISDYGWLEDHFGKLVPMELVVRVPPETKEEGETPAMGMLERVEAVSHIQSIVEQTFGERGMDVVGQAMSTATFLPDLPPPSNGSDFGLRTRRYQFDQQLTAAREELKSSDYFRVEQSGPFVGSDLYRISLRVSALSDVDYGRFIYQLREAVEPALEAYRSDESVTQQLAGEQSSKLRVIVLGRQPPAPIGVEPVLKPSDTPTGGKLIDQRAIYETTFAELLRNHNRARLEWHDPSSGGLAGKSTAEGWGKKLASADLVILMREHEDYDVSFIKEHSQKLLDVRQVPFDRTEPAIVDSVPAPERAGPLHVIYTGVIPVVYKAQRTLLYSLVESIAWAFVLIAAVMAILLNPGSTPYEWFYPRNLGYGLAAGLVAMIPNVFPVAVVFGAMCHMGIKIDIGTMMTASVAMGVAVDDTIHFLSWFRQHLDAGMTRIQAISATYRRVGPAMTQTTIVGGLGLFVFSLSSFTPTQRFGMLMLVMLFAALIGDLIFLPALLASPLGRFFKARTPKTPNAPTTPIPVTTPPSNEDAAAAPGYAGDDEPSSALSETDGEEHAKSQKHGVRSDAAHRRSSRSGN